MNNVKTLEKNFNINKNSIELYIEVSVDGKKIIDKKSDSLVGNFLKTLYSQFGGRIPIPASKLLSKSAVSGNNNAHEINSVNSSGDAVVVGTGQDAVTYTDETVINCSNSLGDYVQIEGVETNTGDDLNGFYQCVRVNATNDYILIDSPIGGTYELTHAFVQSGYDSSAIAGATEPNNPAIVVSGSTAPIEIDSYYVEEQIQMRTADNGIYPEKTLQVGNITVSDPFVDDTSSLFTITQSFFNGTNETISIRKAGLFGGVNGQALLLAEDFITSELAPTETLSVNYKIINSTTAEGGILSQFTKILHTFMSGKREDLTLTQVNGEPFVEYPNTTGSTSLSNVPLSAISMAGGNNIPHSNTRGPGLDEAWKIGPILGSADRNVKNTDYTLLDASDVDSVIPHGDGADELFYHGSTVHSWNEDTGAGTAQFTISRFFENKSGAPVTVRQIGLNTGFFAWWNNSVEVFVFCQSSNTLVSAETFQDGDVGVVNITISVEV